ncbi:MAG: GNAT family N-acetyltransferase [Deltaproteobacteria bacterium]|nr:GNAT family N-acetyltransferase [Deltaproteobacteria bacterium]
MNDSSIKIRLMKTEDFEAVLGIDEKILKVSRQAYYEMKFEKLFETKDYLPASFVAEAEDGKVVGYIMGELYMGQYGIFQERATLDTIGVDPTYQRKGVGKRLIDEFIQHLKKAGVKKVNALISWNNPQLMLFFGANQFTPSKTINLERSL